MKYMKHLKRAGIAAVVVMGVLLFCLFVNIVVTLMSATGMLLVGAGAAAAGLAWYAWNAAGEVLDEIQGGGDEG